MQGDGVDVEEVPRGIRAGRLRRRVGVCERDVIKRVPLEADETCPQVDFLEEGVGYGAVGWTPVVPQVAADCVIDGQQRGAAGGDFERVQVRLIAVARANGG